MEQLRQIIMDCLAEFFYAEEPDCACSGPDKCHEVEDIEKSMRETIYEHKKAIQENDKLIAALMADFDALKACIEDQRDEMADMKRRLVELEKRPSLVEIPANELMHPFQPGPRGWSITCNR
jgi:predicted RNase H-like nuclease (RuvC/YqgF family)